MCPCCSNMFDKKKHGWHLQALWALCADLRAQRPPGRPPARRSPAALLVDGDVAAIVPAGRSVRCSVGKAEDLLLLHLLVRLGQAHEQPLMRVVRGLRTLKAAGRRIRARS